MPMMRTTNSFEGLDPSVIARLVIEVFDHWRLSTKDQLDMLGLSQSNRAVLSRFRESIPDILDQDAIERAGHLIAIHRSLLILFPKNHDLAYSWITTGNKAFDGRMPLEVIRDFGDSGLLMVRNYLSQAQQQ